jgi:hypothetical protein
MMSKESDIVAECFSAHYTNIFLIYLYNEARKYAGTNSNIPSITEGYKTAIASYNNAMSRNDFVKQTLNGVYNQFMKINKTMRVRECTAQILMAFYPEDGYKGIVKQDKLVEMAIGKIIHDLTKLIIYTVPVNHAKNIIDNNDDINTQKAMQDDFKEIALELMERNHIEYVNKKKSQYHSPGTDHVMFEKAKQELARVTAEKAEIETRYGVLQKQLGDLQSLNNELREKAGNQQGRIRELEQQVARLQTAPPPMQTHPQPQYYIPAPVIQMPMAPASAPAPMPAYQEPARSNLVQTGQLAPQYSMHRPAETRSPEQHRVEHRSPEKRVRRDYSHILGGDSDSDDSDHEKSDHEKPHTEVPHPKKNLLTKPDSDDYEINLDMFSK